MHVFLLAPNFAGMGGYQTQLTALAIGLTEAGVKVEVYIREPVRRGHPFWQQMSKAGVLLHAPAEHLARILSPRVSFGRAAYDTVVMFAALLMSPLILADAFLRRRSIRRSWQGATGKIGGWLGSLVEYDGLTWWMERQLDWNLSRLKPDVIDVQHSMLPSGIVYGKSRGLPVVYTEYGAPSDNLTSVWSGLRGVINSADFVVARSQASITGLQWLCGMDRPYEIVPNAVMTACDEGLPPLVRDESVVTITTVGRLSPEKGPQILLKAFKLLTEEGLPVRLVFAGDGPLRTSLEQQAAQWELPKVVFTGIFDDLSLVMNEAHIIAHPTLNDGRSVSVLEAMAWGKPIVAARTGGIPELIEENVSGILVPPDNPEALAAALKRLVLEPETRMRLGQAAHTRFVDGGYTRRAMVTATLKIYERVIRTANMAQA